ncbi:unnamed protein product [Dibothriocephalus latus]|uniref:Uncharacterized protein n=1 Tax=Dibothriocephalus latus TaxID=60516 RepID=A0A3P7LCU4_DIBLA|nr:unnamed protein product [Dibothriocephalus latus]
MDDQPNSMAELLAHKYTADYDEYRKQWREVDNLMKPRASCKPIVPKVFNTNPLVKKKKCSGLIRLDKVELKPRQMAAQLTVITFRVM